MATIEINRLGSNRRFVVTNLSGHPQGIDRGFSVQRGAVPEKPIGELKNGLDADRLSFHRFRANAFKLLEHTLAYALVVLHREATAAVPEVAKAEVNTLRLRLWKVAAEVTTSVRRIWVHFAATWPHRALWIGVRRALQQFVIDIQQAHAISPVAAAALLS